MAQIKSSKKSEGLCEKIQNVVGPFLPRIRRISNQPRGPVSITGDKSFIKNISPQTKPVHVLNQSKTIPVELRHSAAHFSAQNSKKESDEREIAIIRGQKFAKPASGKEELARPEMTEQLPPPPPHHVHFAKASSKRDEDHHSVHHEGKFSDYISKFKQRMMKTASHVGRGGGGGGGSGGGNSARKDSFNDKVSNYIDKTKMKIRTTTNVGDDHNNN